MPDKSTFSKWYKENAKEHNSARKSKYKTDPEYRAAIIARQREYRKNNPAPSRAGESTMRLVAGIPVEVFRIGHVASQIGRSEQVIRKWESLGYIPKTTIPGNHRFYNQSQINLMQELADLIDVTKVQNKEVFDEVLGQKKFEIAQKWAL